MFMDANHEGAWRRPGHKLRALQKREAQMQETMQNSVIRSCSDFKIHINWQDTRDMPAKPHFDVIPPTTNRARAGICSRI